MVRILQVGGSTNLNQLTANQVNEANKAFKAVVIQMRNLAVQNCPVDTGALKSSVASFPVENGADGECQLGSNMDYADFVHDGTHKMPARPFIQYAIDQLEPQLEQAVFDAINNNP